ncbi:MAG: YjbH domain-containing protein [Ignavibacteria bacterium]|nr:YjbH domain-containing protein [Ignavibacteria bacterium]MDH7527269.1 YjbH domain-containing protein [Ignavibacteria bacterium]
MKIKFIKFFFILLMFNSQILLAQGSAGTKSDIEPRYLVDMNTAGILQKGMFAITTEQLPNGVFILKMDVGIFNQFNFGISYGAANFVGKGEMKFYKYPGVNVRFRLFDEEPSFPAILLGFDSQGKGEFIDSIRRFEVKSPGFYLVASKNFNFMGLLSLHGGLNYSLETSDQDKNLNLMVGVEKTVGQQISIVAEYDFGLNDDENKVGRGRGYLNAGIRWSIGKGLTLGFDFRNLANNRITDTFGGDRAFRLEFAAMIF